jgi:MFS transporter, PAT family, beta-lactamase induction signal transducer AmpG
MPRVSRGGPLRKLGVLWTLYFVQGLPFGFQATALPIYLRTAGVSLTEIGLVMALSLPWSLKILWAPLVDRFGSPRLGRRRSWILPLQGALALSCLAAAAIPPGHRLRELLFLVFVMNLVAATLDIAVDGLAVDVLSTRELGQGNIAQVVGYKAGMLVGGGLLVWASGRIGWQGLFLAMAALTGACFLVPLAWHERRPTDPGGQSARAVVHPRLGEIVRVLRRVATAPGAGWFLLFIGTYKFGESMADTMFKPFLVDAGFAPERIGLWVGTWGLLFSIAGSIGGGVLAGRLPLLRAVAVTAVLRVLPVAGEWWLTMVDPTPGRVLAITCAENFFGGALTTALFAYMMSRVDRRIGATHYTLLAAVEVWGKLPAAWVSGWLADRTSYGVVFATATVLSIGFLGLLAPLQSELWRRRRAAAPAR